MKSNIRFVFFGTSHIAVYVLDELKRAGLIPSLIITMPDRPKGRGMGLTPPEVKKWALENRIDLLQPGTVDSPVFDVKIADYDVAVVCDFGKILPRHMIEAPHRGTLNVHPSLLPRLRGASPIRSAILNDEKTTGVTIIVLDEKMDHGPIIAQKKVQIPVWPPYVRDLEEHLMTEGGKLLAQVLPLWVDKQIEPMEQNHDIATYCGKISRDDGLLDLNGDPYKNLLKIRGLAGWPGTFAFFKKAGKDIRVKIVEAHIEKSQLVIDAVVPEGKKPMAFKDFERSLK